MIIKYLKFEVEISYFLRKFRPASAGWQFYGMELPKTNVNNCDDIITKQLQYVRISPCRCATSECWCSVCSSRQCQDMSRTCACRSRTCSGYVQDTLRIFISRMGHGYPVVGYFMEVSSSRSFVVRSRDTLAFEDCPKSRSPSLSG